MEYNDPNGKSGQSKGMGFWNFKTWSELWVHPWDLLKPVAAFNVELL